MDQHATATPELATPHRLHAPERPWSLTNCYVDLWIELLHARGMDAVHGLGFTVTQDFEGDQFTFFKFPHADLEALFGVVVQELALFDRLERHVATQVARGHVVLVEVDGFHLPDTRTTSYQTMHAKTTIGVDRMDVAEGRCGYFHNGGYYALAGQDYRHVFGLDAGGGGPMFPYAEFARFGGGPVQDPRAVARRLLAAHLRRRPTVNPITAFRAAFPAHLDELLARETAYFHLYTFNMFRQLGANFALLGDHLAWLDDAGGALGGLAAHCTVISETARMLQLKLARSVARRRADLHADAFDAMEDAYGRLMEGLVHHAG